MLKRADIILLCMNKSTTCKASEIVILFFSVLETALQEKLEPNGKMSWGNRNQRKLGKCDFMVCIERRKAVLYYV